MSQEPIDPAAPKIHIYLPGQSLADIAISNNLSLDELLLANSLTEQSILYPGLKLVIPDKPAPKVEKPLVEAHIVVAGENLREIASRYDIDLSELLQINNLDLESVVLPGTKLFLVRKPVPLFSSTRAPQHCLIHGYHKVKSGDQLNRIAALHAVSMQSLLTANNLTWNSIVTPGSKIIIPISHTPLNCPSLVQLPEIAFQIATRLLGFCNERYLTEYQAVIALCLEMQRSGLLPELGNKSLQEKLVLDLSQLENCEDLSVEQALVQAGYKEYSEGASLWEPSAWLWLHQIRSMSE
ncbi:MAG: hypothetical protein RIQ88_98 [Actinomycetota bacterium]